jgi:hypothetical protein
MRSRSLLIILMTILVSLPALAQPRRVVVHHRPPRALEPSPFQFVLEGGAALPLGDLGDPFVGTERGLGAGTGYELGARLRYYIGPATAVGPSFHWVDFADWEDVDATGAPYAVRTSLYRYGLDIHQFLTERGTVVRPYLTVGGALVHNRYQDWIRDEGTFDATSTNLSFAAGGGLAMGPVEVSVTWNYNPASLRQLVPVGADDAFDWSWWSVRGALAFGP